MSEDKKKTITKTQIILLAIPPYLLSSFEEGEESKNLFLTLANIGGVKDKIKEWKEKKNIDILAFAESLNKTDFSSQLLKILEDNQGRKKIILVNYPRTKENLQKLEEAIAGIGRSIKAFIFVYKEDEHFEEVALKLKAQNLICPACERVYKKETNIKENTFLCPNDGITLSQKESEDFTEFYNDFYNNYYSPQQLVEIINYHKAKERKIIHPQLLMKTDFDPTNLRNYLLEKIKEI